MSKGKDFRGPRKRGYDDEGPSSFDFRPPRAPYGSSPPSSGGGGFSSHEAPPSGPPTDATVKWFKGDKGFGFVELANDAGDAFLHINVLHPAGYETVPSGSKLKVLVGQGAKGTQVTRVLEVDTSTATPEPPRGERPAGGNSARPPRFAPDPTNAVDVSGVVKWFDNAKGFGFASSDDGGKDVFVHISILRPAGVETLEEGQTLEMRVVDTPKGREAVSISVP